MADDDLTQGQSFGPYVIEGILGRGGMGTVYRARERALDRVVALKLISTGFSSDAGWRERFQREARLGAALEHPNIVPVYAAGEIEGRLFLSMRYVDGVDLNTLVARAGALPPARALDIIEPVAEALDAAHDAGLVHRDVKPANILVGPDGRDGRPRVYLTDFGLTRRSSEQGMTRTGTLLGTVFYMAPEQVEGLDDVGPAADQYALAVTLYEALSGHRPFTGPDTRILVAHLSDAPPPATRFRPELGPEVDAVLVRALAKKPEDRFPTCVDLVRALRAALPPDLAAAHGAAAAAAAAGTIVRAPAGATEIRQTPSDAPAVEGAAAPAPAAEPAPASVPGGTVVGEAAAVVAGGTVVGGDAAPPAGGTVVSDGRPGEEAVAGGTAISEPAADDAPDGGTMITQPAADDAPSGGTAISQPAADEAPAGGTAVSQPAADDAPAGGTMISQPAADDAPAGGTMISQPAADDAPAGGTMISQPAAAAAAAGGTMLRSPDGGTTVRERPPASPPGGGGGGGKGKLIGIAAAVGVLVVGGGAFALLGGGGGGGDDPATTAAAGTTAAAASSAAASSAAASSAAASSAESPATSAATTAAATSAPATSAEEPATSAEEPATTSEEPATSAEEPATTAAQPDAFDRLAESAVDPKAGWPPREAADVAVFAEPADGKTVTYAFPDDQTYTIARSGTDAVVSLKRGVEPKQLWGGFRNDKPVWGCYRFTGESIRCDGLAVARDLYTTLIPSYEGIVYKDARRIAKKPGAEVKIGKGPGGAPTVCAVAGKERTCVDESGAVVDDVVAGEGRIVAKSVAPVSTADLAQPG